MARKQRIGHRLAAAIAAGSAGLALASTAGAVDLRSWDQRINDATKRFVVLPAFGSQAVLDKETQLVWERSPHPTPTSWFNSAYAACGVKSVGGRRGWRLPSLFEFMTLIDTSVSGGVKLPQGHPFVAIQANDDFWTSTAALSTNIDAAIGVDIGTSLLTSYPRGSYAARPWCVRGPGNPGGY